MKRYKRELLARILMALGMIVTFSCVCEDSFTMTLATFILGIVIYLVGDLLYSYVQFLKKLNRKEYTICRKKN